MFSILHVTDVPFFSLIQKYPYLPLLPTTIDYPNGIIAHLNFLLAIFVGRSHEGTSVGNHIWHKTIVLIGLFIHFMSYWLTNDYNFKRYPLRTLNLFFPLHLSDFSYITDSRCKFAYIFMDHQPFILLYALAPIMFFIISINKQLINVIL